MYSAMLMCFVLITITFLLLYKYFTGNNNYWKNKGIDFIPPAFPLGNFRDVLMAKASIGAFLKSIYETSSNDMVGFWIFRTPHLIIRSPELIKNVLVKDFNYFSDRTIVSDEKSDSLGSKLLLTLKNPEWKHMRTKVSPIFTSSKLKQMTALVNRAALDLKAYLSKSNSEVLDVKEISAKYTTDLITSCAFGVDAHSFENDDAPFRAAGRRMLDISFTNGVRQISYFLLPGLVKLFRINFFDPKAISFLREAFWNTIEQREKSLQKRNDLIDILIQLRKEEHIADGIKFEGDRVVAQAVQFYVAGFETTSSAITYALYELSLNPDFQTKARQEIRDIYKEFGELTYEVLPKLKYLEKVIAETLRKYPSLPFLDRRCLMDYKVPNSDVVIEKDTPVFIPMLGIHYNPEYYPNPEKFDPERFSQENVEKRTPYTYLPFGHGPHNCIGERFAMIATKLGLAHILMNFEVNVCKETPIPLVYNPTTFILQILGPLKLSVKKIN